MDPGTKRRLETRARIIKALAHPTRLFIVEELAAGERCVCELTEKIGADISTVSKHLALMKNAGIVRDEKRGLNVYYRLQASCALRFLDCAENILRASLAEQMEGLAREPAARNDDKAFDGERNGGGACGTCPPRS